MATGKTITAAVIAMTIAVVFLGPVFSIVDGNSGTVGVDENATIQTDSWADLEGYEITSNFTLYDDTGTQLIEGTDYELNSTAGTIQALSGSTAISSGDTVNAVYDYQATSGTTTTIVTLVPTFIALLILGTAAAKMQQMM